jgi:hypothetical protein
LSVTKTHAPVAERAIRSFKNIMYRRIDAKPERQIQWTNPEILAKSLTTYNYHDEEQDPWHHAQTRLGTIKTV